MRIKIRLHTIQNVGGIWGIPGQHHYDVNMSLSGFLDGETISDKPLVLRKEEPIEKGLNGSSWTAAAQICIKADLTNQFHYFAVKNALLAMKPHEKTARIIISGAIDKHILPEDISDDLMWVVNHIQEETQRDSNLPAQIELHIMVLEEETQLIEFLTALAKELR